MKILPVDAELFHADGRMDGHEDMTKHNSRVSLFCQSA